MRLLSYLVLPLAVVAAYLLFWPVPIEPQMWEPPPLPGPRHPYNEALRAVERIGEGQGVGSGLRRMPRESGRGICDERSCDDRSRCAGCVALHAAVSGDA